MAKSGQFMSGADPHDIEAFVRQYARLVRTVAMRVGGARGREVADDVEQRVFLSIWQQMQREQTITNPSSYVYRCAVRETVRMLTEIDEPAEADPVELDQQPGGDTPADRLARRERARLTAEALRDLAVDRRRAVQAHLAGFSVNETMTMYQWSYQRARNLVARGMTDLRAGLRKRGIDG